MSNNTVDNVTNRITLTDIRIINWSRFQDETIHINGSALVTGVNGTGKSTILDALTYVLLGNQKFNKAADDKDRSVVSYVRGDTKSTKSDARYLRTGPVVSYIVLQWYNPQTKKNSVTAVCIESPDESHHYSNWFIEDDAKISDFGFSEHLASGKKGIVPLSQLKFKGTKYTGPFYSPEKAKEPVLRNLGLRCDIKDYRSKMLKVIAFKPEPNINNFISQCVLDPKPVESLKNILEHKDKTDRMKEELDRCNAERKLLSTIIQHAENYEKAQQSFYITEMMYAYQNVLLKIAEKEKTAKEIEALNAQLQALQDREGIIDDRLNKAQRVYIEAEKSEAYSDLRPVIDEKENAMRQIQDDLDLYMAAMNQLTELDNALHQDLAWLFRLPEAGGIEKDLSLLLSNDDDMSDIVIPAFSSLCVLKRKEEEMLRNRRSELSLELKNAEAKITSLSANVRNLESNKPSIPDDIYMAVAALRREFAKRGINAQIRIFAELVSSFSDDSWRKAIEAYLGRHRYDLIVDPQYASDAVRYRQALQLNQCSVVYTHLIDDNGIVPGSAAELLDIPNASARKYANYLLNGLHLCDTIEEMEKYPRGSIMRDGTLARGYTSSGIRGIDKINYCLGFNAINMELYRVRAALKDAQQEKEQFEKELKTVDEKLTSLNLVKWDSTQYRFDAPSVIPALKEQLSAQQIELDSLKNNPDFLASAQARENARIALNEATSERDAHIAKKAMLQQKLEQMQKDYTASDANITVAQKNYANAESEHPDLSGAMKAKYSALSKKKNGDINVISDSTLISARRELADIGDLLKEAQMQYSHVTNADTAKYGVEYIAYYRSLFAELQNVRIEHAMAELDKAKRSLRDLVVNDFLSEMANIIDDAKAELSSINAELKELPFGRDIYQFVMLPRKDRAAFFRQCRRLDDAPAFSDPSLCNDESSQAELDEFIDEMVKDIIDGGGDQDEYADYRRYFTYTMQVTSREGHDDITFDLATKYGSSSGGEKQTPNLIILAASLMQCYPRSSCCERMMFIDESFANLSAERINQLVKYLEDNHFQVIYAAPPEKLSTIGVAVPNTIGLISSGRYTHVKDFSVT